MCFMANIVINDTNISNKKRNHSSQILPISISIAFSATPSKREFESFNPLYLERYFSLRTEIIIKEDRIDVGK